MIVKCARCQTRFKIPDEKVTEKGVKVRCTKCQNTFRVTRESGGEDAGASSPSPSAGQADPFAAFGAAADPKGVEITRPGFFAQGVAATRTAPTGPPGGGSWNSMDGDLDTEDGVFREPTRVGPMPLPPAQSAGAPVAGSPGVAAVRNAGAVALPGAAQPVRPPVDTSTGLYGGAVPPPVDEAAASRQAGPVPLPGIASRQPPGVAAPRGAPARTAPPPAPGSAASRGADLADPFADFLAAPAGAGGADPFDALPAPAAPGAKPPAPPADADPFASIDIDDATVPALPAPRAVAPPAAEDDPFASIDIDDTTMAAPPPFAPAPPASAPVAGQTAAPRGAMGQPPPRAAQAGAPSAPRAGAPSTARPPAHAAGAAPFEAPKGATLPGRPAAPPADPFASLDLGDATQAGGPPVSAADPFGSLDLGDATQAGRPPPDPFAALDSSDATHPGRPPAAPGRVPGRPPAAPAPVEPFLAPSDATLPGRPPSAADPFASLDLGDATHPGHPPSAASPGHPLSSPPGAQDLFDLNADGGDAFGEHAGLEPSDTGRAALFGDVSPGALDHDGSHGASLGSLLDDVPPVDSGPGGGVTLGRVGVGVGQREVLELDPTMSAAPVVSVAKPTARPEDVGIPQARPPSRARKVTALFVNLVVAAALVVGLGALGWVYLHEGRVDFSVLSPERLRSLVVPAPTPLVALDVSNGLYETQSGKPLFFVRGDAENRTGSATHLRVRGALFDGNQRVRSVEGLAGSVATPEELFAVGNTESALALRQRMDAAAVSVAPGARAPFLLVFHEYPAALDGFRLEVTVEAVPAPASAAPAPAEPTAPAQAKPTE
ncbi:zinc-ribbon domain-containing protein [Myxococcus fulvus]|uniref:zinc-ribbon domain-containing protein n=1 Tax=Myxococcus fulvus TaxID=33 RepID=UPI003B9B7F37